MKLLIVEDEFGMAEFIAKVFEEDCERILTAEDGLQALQLFNQNPEISCVISDINMPRMNGIELCKELKQKSPETHVFLMTAEPSHQENALLAGAEDVIIKPFRMNQLRSWMLEKISVGQSVKKE